MANTTGALESPAVPLLVELHKKGFICWVTEEGALRVQPGKPLSPEQRGQLIEFKDEVVDALTCCDERRDEFRRQFAETESNTIPTFVFVKGIPYRPGWCFSCGATLATTNVSRCWCCSIAMRLALWGAGLYALAPALDEARVA